MTRDIGPLGRLPADMRALPQWVLAGADKVPLAVDHTGKLRKVSPTRPSEWMSFEQAVWGMQHHAALVTTHTTEQGQVITRTGLDVGFVLHEADPFSCIDLDTKDAVTHPDKPEVWTSPDDFQRYVSIINSMDSYTERSRSGKGIHVWVRGNIGRGFKRDGVEVYSQERYLICTGDVYVDKPIADRGQMLENMVAQMRPIREGKIKLVELDPDADDWYVFQVAAEAANSDKFWKLWRGDWQGDYATQSEADLALMSMFTFYSDSNKQCRALFRASALGKREKSQKDDRYLDFTLQTIRERQERERSAELGGILSSMETVSALRAAVEAAQGTQAAPSSLDPHRSVEQLANPGQGEPMQPPPPPASALAQLAPVPPRVVAEDQGLEWPPGFVGKVAQYIFENSYLPIKEVSIVAALGLMAGICGKGWHIPQSGLNLYIVLVARSAIGKEAMHTGIASLVGACSEKNISFSSFVNFNEFASGPALIKACMQEQSFVNVSGEWGRKMKRMALDERGDGPVQTLRTQMTNLYQKSGPQSIAGGITYSSEEKNVASVAGVAYSMIGETTPDTFYESLTDSMMEDGFLSRFLIIGYDGDRPARNHTMLERPDDALRDALCDIAGHAGTLMAPGNSQLVGRTEEAAAIIDAFDRETHENITKNTDESRRQMWNRALLKALRVAALLAVGDHYMTPVINRAHIEWAIALIRNDIAMMSQRFAEGDVGNGDSSRERKLMATIKKYITAKEIAPGYRIDPKMHAQGIVPRSYLQARTQHVSAFRNHKLGASKALDASIDICVSNGWLMDVKRDKLVEHFSHHGRALRVLDFPDFNTT